MDGIVEMKIMSRRRFFKRAARKMLYSDWINQILVFVIVGAFFVGINYFGTSVAIIVSELSDKLIVADCVSLAFNVISMAFTVPMFYGIVRFEINTVSEEEAVLSDVFAVFSDSQTVLRSYNLFFNVIFRGIVCFLPAIALYFFKHLAYDYGFVRTYSYYGVDVVSFLLNTVFVLLIYLGIAFSSNLFTGIYISVKNENAPVEDCFYMAKKCMRGSKSEFALLALSFLPLFVVSLFSIGFLFVLYTVPYMFITFIMFSKYLYEKKEFPTASYSNQEISD